MGIAAAVRGFSFWCIIGPSFRVCGTPAHPPLCYDRTSSALEVKGDSNMTAHGERTISEVARQAGVRPSAIRYYESVGLLPPPARVNGRRRYDADVLQRLAVIGWAQRMGFTIAEIGTFLHGFSADTPAWARWQALATGKLPEINALIEQAE